MKDNKIDDILILKDYNEISKLTTEEILTKYHTKEEGLTNKEAQKRLNNNGKNIVIKEVNRSIFYFIFNSLKEEFIIILLVLAVINFSLGDKLGSLVIVLIAIISMLIRVLEDYSAYKFNKKLRSKIVSTTKVIRDNKELEIKVENVVVGDIISLNAGSIIPADCIVINSKDLFVNESVFTGESIPVEKKETNKKEYDNLFDIKNVLYMSSSVISGTAKAIVVKTGFDTYLGKIGKEINTKKNITAFDKGMKDITNMLIKFMVVICLIILLVDGIIRSNFTEAILFAFSVAVGITPSMLPMIVNVNLTKGTKALAKKKVLVKHIESIQNLGAIDTLCTDKTGTLTENKIVLQKYIDVLGNEDNSILEYAYINSYYSSGMKNIVDRAIMIYGSKHNLDNILPKYEKIDEIPFDYNRKVMSIIVRNKNTYRMITKGAMEEVLKRCTKVKVKGKEEDLTKELIDIVTNKAKEMATSGMQVLALAAKKTEKGVLSFDENSEKEMTFIGFVAFLDSPKKDVKKVINKLRKYGVKTKILTGDNPYSTTMVASLAGINSDEILTGAEIDKLSDKALSIKVEEIDVFARLNPIQKERVVRILKSNGHVVGYMGDGINDAPSLRQSDVGLSVNTATDIAKETSDMILLEKNLEVIADGIIEGRKVYGNIIKYMKMALSADFGDVFSIMIASIFLPFLPLLPIQMLFQDFIYDFSQIGIPYDNVDEEFITFPKKWNTKGIAKFMIVMGITSSIIDVLAFLTFWHLLGYNSIDKESYFQTAWFITSLITELMIIYNVRTSKDIFNSRPSKVLLSLTLLSSILTIVTPLLLHNVLSFHFEILSIKFYLYLLSLVILYVLIVSIVKRIYIKKNHEWL
ncbi:MAG: magnesium-translocating P-type ATPase [Bacilli bacterium]|nr:magnesium-translocating P-type ATPase [Bacilli bacterium]